MWNKRDVNVILILIWNATLGLSTCVGFVTEIQNSGRFDLARQIAREIQSRARLHLGAYTARSAITGLVGLTSP